MLIRLLMPLLALLASSSLAAPLKPEEVPEPLKPWVDWVLHDQQQAFCPLRFNNRGARLCHWPSRMELSVGDRGGDFRLELSQHAPGWIQLPGDGPRWPMNVTANGQGIATQSRNKLPSVWLEPGRYTLEGRFEWNTRPESLRVPRDTGLVKLRVSGVEVRHPQRDERDQLWLGKKARDTPTKANRLALRVFRLIDDDIPMQVNTRIEIDVGGEVREEVIGPALLSGQVPLDLEGPLPVRIEDDGRLRLQMRPGRWTVNLISRSRSSVESLPVSLPAAPWPQQEIWSLRAHHDLRVVEPEGLTPTDPRQTGVTPQWHSYPAFIANNGDSLTLKQTRRGSPDIEPDRLQLSRQLWLDFDGSGYTVQDSLSGSLAQTWRLSTRPAIALGRVAVDGTPQLITRHEDQIGVEVRHGQLQLAADGRIESRPANLPVGGWKTDFQSVNATLHLPPAWRVFAAPGVDRVPGTWLSNWTLLDLFLVLVTTIAAMRLFGWPTAVLTLVTLTLTWHVHKAPGYVWLNLIAALALLRALPKSFESQGLLYKLLLGYKWLSAAALLLIAIPFAIDQARLSLYPQLENQGRLLRFDSASHKARGQAAEQEAATLSVDDAAMPVPAPPASPMPRVSSSMAKADVLAEGLEQQIKRAVPQRNYAQSSIQSLDPNVLTQTGPGVPAWNWNSLSLQWSGPVTADQDFSLWLMPPWLTRSLGWLSILLVALLASRWLAPEFKLPRPGRFGGHAAALGLSLILVLPSADAASPVKPSAVPPSQDLLEELRQRLTRPPDCVPNCANLSRLHIDVSASQILTMRLTAEAAAESAISLPVPRMAAGQNRVWQPDQVLINDRDATLLRGTRGMLWVLLPPGRHELILRGTLNDMQELQLPMSPRPQQVSVRSPGWLASGVTASGQASSVVTLSREVTQASKGKAEKHAEQRLPPMLRLSRTLQLGLLWEVQSSLVRHGDVKAAQTVRVSALPGEVVTGESVRLQDGQIEASFSPGQRQVQWNSRIDIAEQILLQAADDTDLFEHWQLDASALWHVSFEGIPAISRQQDNWRLPSWRPWPGESLSIQISRPEAVAGRILTLDQVRLHSRPGKRATDLQLEMKLRASQGGQHALPLPDTVSIQAVRIDGRAVPAQTEGGRLLLPLRPGVQNIVLELRQDHGISAMTTLPAFDLKVPGVNARMSLSLPQDRWVLFAGGPALGPAVLFWGVLAVLLAIAITLGRSGLTPLGSLQWALLMVGLSQLPVVAAAIVASWLFALALRAKLPSNWSAGHFNAIQILLALWTVAALLCLASAVWQGLLGAPDMQVAGNGSSQHSLHWYQDRFDGTLPSPWALSVWIGFYHGLMLLWAMWLANSLLNWLRWGWQQYSQDALWKKPSKLATDRKDSHSQPEEST